MDGMLSTPRERSSKQSLLVYWSKLISITLYLLQSYYLYSSRIQCTSVTSLQHIQQENMQPLQCQWRNLSFFVRCVWSWRLFENLRFTTLQNSRLIHKRPMFPHLLELLSMSQFWLQFTIACYVRQKSETINQDSSWFANHKWKPILWCF